MKTLFCTSAMALALATPAWAQGASEALPQTGQVTDTAQATQADTGPSDASGIQEIVITANRRQESIQKSSLAIAVVGGQSLAQAGVTQAVDLPSVVPGLTISQGGAAVQTYLRGVGTTATDANAEGAIAYNINGVYISRPNGIGPIFFDLERVEVLKGPQGTLYGRNASGGAINLITRRPTQAVDGEVSVDIGNFDLRRVSLAVGGGVSDSFAVRAAMQYTKRDGYLTDGYDDQDSISGRLSALFTPSEAVSLLVVGEYSHQQGQGNGVVKRSDLAPTPANRWEGSSVGNAQQPPTAFIPGGTRFFDDGNIDVDVRAISAQLDVDLGPATLTFLPAYRYTRPENLTYSPGFRFDSRETSKQQSYELRLGRQTGDLKWTVGGFYFDEKQTQVYELQAIPIQRGTTATQLFTKSYAAFADANLSVSETFRVLGGIRYSKDKKGQGGSTVAVLPAPATTNNFSRFRDDRVTWRAGVEFDAAPQNMLFATVSTGYKAGGFFPSVPFPNNVFAPEKLTAYTVGSRNRFLDNAVQFNVEGFYWKYRDKQERFLGATPSGTTGLLTTNAGSATLYGFSADLVVKPVRNGTFQAGLEYLHSNYDSFAYDVYNPSVGAFINAYPAEATTCALGAPVPFTANDFVPALRGDSTQRLDCSGKPLVRAPKWVGSVSYDHVFELGDDNTLTAGVDGQYSSSYFMTPDFIDSSEENGYFLVNADLTLRLNNGLSFAAWGRNLTKTAVYSGGFRYPFSRGVAAGGDPTLFYAQIRAPRTYGITVKAGF